MPKRASWFPGSLTRLGRLSAWLFVAPFAACESTPCVGDACPGACGDADCGGTTPLAEPGTPGRFTSCASSASCDEASGFACVDGLCRHACSSHFDCGGVAVCDRRGTGDAYCSLTNPPTQPGGYYSSCPDGECTRGFTCVGAGIGDTDSYCSSDCSSDRDCPAGFLCSTIQSASGGERKLCTPRGYCAACETHADCLSVPRGVCARDESGEKRCTEFCSPGTNSCPWGDATDCRLTDDDLGVPTCQHRFGACVGEGNGCDPCQSDDDCPFGQCFVSSYTGERWCIDDRVSCSCEGFPNTLDFCAGANGCPASPSGVGMVCFDPAPFGGGICVGVNLPGSAFTSKQLSCWQ
jgi:hypothetical protein